MEYKIILIINIILEVMLQVSCQLYITCWEVIANILILFYIILLKNMVSKISLSIFLMLLNFQNI